MLKWIKKKLGFNKEDMVTVEHIIEGLKKHPFYQWVKSENTGQVVQVTNASADEEGNIWVDFDNGTRVNRALMDEYLIGLSGREEAREIGDGMQAEAQAILAKVGRATFTEAPPTPKSPVVALLEKQKPNPASINVPVELNLPSHELYSVLTASFENAEEEVVEYITSLIDVSAIRESVRTALREHYSYSGPSKVEKTEVIRTESIRTEVTKA